MLHPRLRPRFSHYGSTVHSTRHGPLQCMLEKRGWRFEVMMDMFAIMKLYCNGLGALGD
jgi:hypothetical protein